MQFDEDFLSDQLVEYLFIRVSFPNCFLSYIFDLE